MTTHLASADSERGVCGHKHHGRTAARDAVTCSYCRHLTEHGPHTVRTVIDLALYEMGNREGAAYKPA